MKLTLNANRDRRKYLIDRVIENAKRNGAIRRTSWLFTLAKKGRFIHVSPDDAEAFATQIDSMITVLNRVHGNKWDFHFDQVHVDNVFRGFYIHIVIHYPGITILNSEDREHFIKDLLVTFLIKNNDYDSYVPYQLSGTRATMSYEEWFNGYRHSHLISNKPSSFNDVYNVGPFCLGEGDLNETLTTMWDSEYEYQDEIFEAFLYAIDSVVEWESLEGTPHIKMETVRIGEASNYIDNLSDKNLKDFHDRFILSLYPPINFDFVFSEDRYEIKQNKKFEDILRELIIIHLPDNVKYLLVTKTDGRLYGYASPIIETQNQLINRFCNNNGELPYTYVQDNKLEFKVEEFSGELPDINNYNVHPKFLNYVSRELEKQLYYKSVRKSAIERHYQTNNA